MSTVRITLSSRSGNLQQREDEGRHGNAIAFECDARSVPFGAAARLLGGFAVLAYPALCGNSGIVTFVANHEGVVYHKTWVRIR